MESIRVEDRQEKHVLVVPGLNLITFLLESIGVGGVGGVDGVGGVCTTKRPPQRLNIINFLIWNFQIKTVPSMQKFVEY